MYTISSFTGISSF